MAGRIKNRTWPNMGPGPEFAHTWSRLFLLLSWLWMLFFAFCTIFGKHCPYYFKFTCTSYEHGTIKSLNLESWDLISSSATALTGSRGGRVHSSQTRSTNRTVATLTWTTCFTKKMTQRHIEVEKCVIFPLGQRWPQCIVGVKRVLLGMCACLQAPVRDKQSVTGGVS